MNEMNFVQTKRSRPRQWLRDFTRQRRRDQGTALAKVRTGFEGCAPFSKVRILENPDDSFEDAQPFSKVPTFGEHLRLDGSGFGFPQARMALGGRLFPDTNSIGVHASSDWLHRLN